MAAKPALKFWNSNLGILILSSAVIAPIGYFVKDYRDDQKQAVEDARRAEEKAVGEQKRLATEAENHRQEVDKLCSELYDRTNRLRDIVAQPKMTAQDGAELITALPNPFPPPKNIPSSFPEFERMPMAAVVGPLERVAASDETIRPLASIIRREYEGARAAYQSEQRLDGRDALIRMTQWLINCRAAVEK